MERLNDTFTSTGRKFFAHQEAMTKLSNGRGQPIVSHVMLTDVCNHSCAFCSVQARAGDSLVYDDVLAYLDILLRYGLKAVILSGGGNPILYKCKKTNKNFNHIVRDIHSRGLEIGLITNGRKLRTYGDNGSNVPHRSSWHDVLPETLDKLTWIRISMSGLDHKEHKVYVPEIDPTKTTLGFSYVAHDLYVEHGDPYHGKVSRRLDLLTGDLERVPDLPFESRVDELVSEFGDYIQTYNPRYLRVLPNCLEPAKIPLRVKKLQCMADEVNERVKREVVFVQDKPPSAPKACYLGYVHPVLNCDGYVYPCDSCVLNEAAGHTFANPWRICHWSDIAGIYERSVRSLIADPGKTCPGCVFPTSNAILGSVVDGTADMTPLTVLPEHHNFV